MQSFLILFLTFFVFSIVVAYADAAQVVDVQGTNVTVQSGDDEMLVSTEKYFILNDSNKKVGIVTITAASENKAHAELIKGVAKKGYKLIPYEQKASAATATPAEAKPISESGSRKKSSEKKSTSNLGVFAEIMINSLSVDLGTTNVTMSGTSFAFAFAYQHNLTESLKARYPIGFRSYGVQAQNSICTTGNCDLSITYLSLGGKLDYFLDDSVSIGGGTEYLLPASKSSSFLSSDQIAANSIVSFGAGWLASPSVPISFSYNMFLGNKDAPASFIAIQTGYLW